MMERPFDIRGRVAQFPVERLAYVRKRVSWVEAVLLLQRVDDMAGDVRKENAPGGWLVAAAVVPHADIHRAVQASLRRPRAEELDGLLVSLGCGRNNKSLH